MISMILNLIAKSNENIIKSQQISQLSLNILQKADMVSVGGKDPNPESSWAVPWFYRDSR